MTPARTGISSRLLEDVAIQPGQTVVVPIEMDYPARHVVVDDVNRTPGLDIALHTEPEFGTDGMAYLAATDGAPCSHFNWQPTRKWRAELTNTGPNPVYPFLQVLSAL